MEQAYDEKARRHICLNSTCGETLFISGQMGPDTTIRGIDREIQYACDEQGAFVTCPKCKTQHEVSEASEPGKGIQWRIIGLRKTQT